MTERAVGRPWSAREDQLLAAAIAVHGQVDNWKAVALSVPGRSNKACRKASPHLLHPADLSPRHIAVAALPIAERQEIRLVKARRQSPFGAL